MKRALITGITGQDGSYLAEFLLAKGYEVHGLMRRVSSFTTGRIEHIRDRLHLHYGDMLDAGSLAHVVDKAKPDEVYNLAAQSHVAVSFEVPEYTRAVNAMAVLDILDAVSAGAPRARVYQASSSEMFGGGDGFQSETTPLCPRSPYATAKREAHYDIRRYRLVSKRFVSCGILFNHESPRRGETFVTRKITRAIGRIVAGTQKTLALGNLDARRDWGFAGDYVEAMWMMLQQEKPGDYVIATGESYSVRDFCEVAFDAAGLNWKDHVTTDERLFRPREVYALKGDATKARRELGWAPRVGFRELVHRMVDADVELARREK